LARLFASGRESRRREATPGCEFGWVVEERLKDVAEDLASVKALLRALVVAAFAGLIGLVVDMIVRGSL
jgi:hypothetical protein